MLVATAIRKSNYLSATLRQLLLPLRAGRPIPPLVQIYSYFSNIASQFINRISLCIRRYLVWATKPMNTTTRLHCTLISGWKSWAPRVYLNVDSATMMPSKNRVKIVIIKIKLINTMYFV